MDRLQALLHPKSVMVVGGSDRTGSVGAALLSNILSGGFEGPVHVVNPHRFDMPGVSWSDTVAGATATADLAIIATPAATVPSILADLGKAGTKMAVVISAVGEDEPLRTAIRSAASEQGIRIVGPNGIGILMPHARLNASFACRQAIAGELALISQSGAVITAILERAAAVDLGFSGIVSAGDASDVDIAEMIDLFAADPATHAIMLHIEGIADAPRFLSAAYSASRHKPVIALKTGRTPAAAHAAFSHTHVLAGNYAVYEAALRRAGVLLVDTLDELLAAAQVLTRHGWVDGDRLAVVTNGGGLGVTVADSIAAYGSSLATLSPDTVEALTAVMPDHWLGGNPIDIQGDAAPKRYATAVGAALSDSAVDCVMVIHCPTAVGATAEAAAHAVADAIRQAGQHRKPVIGCWIGAEHAQAARAILGPLGVPLFDDTDDAVRGLHWLVHAKRVREDISYAGSHQNVCEFARARANVVVALAHTEGRKTLLGRDALDVLAAYGIAAISSRSVADAGSVAGACANLKPPFALKLLSADLPHKSDVGGVRLNLESAEAVASAAAQMLTAVTAAHPEARIDGFEVQEMAPASAYPELIIGLSQDPVFGPVIAFGSGGKAVEVIKDIAVGLPPLDEDLARDLIGRTRVSKLLAGYRDVPSADIDALVGALRGISALAVDIPEIAELDINPLVIGPDGPVALDARIRLDEAAHVPPAILPAPARWCADLKTRDGVEMHVRPARPEDQTVLADFFQHVSPEDLRFRFLSPKLKVDHDQLVAMTRMDYRRAVNFLAFVDDGTLIASAMLVGDGDGEKGELAISVRPEFKAKGVSWTLMRHALRFARDLDITTVQSVESRGNLAALTLEQEAGFKPVGDQDGGDVTVERRLESQSQ